MVAINLVPLELKGLIVSRCTSWPIIRSSNAKFQAEKHVIAKRAVPVRFPVGRLIIGTSGGIRTPDFPFYGLKTTKQRYGMLTSANFVSILYSCTVRLFFRWPLELQPATRPKKYIRRSKPITTLIIENYEAATNARLLQKLEKYRSETTCLWLPQNAKGSIRQLAN